MPIDLIDYALAEERESESIGFYALTGGENQLAIQALGLIQQNPDLFIKEYPDYDPDDIDTLIDAALTALMDDTVSQWNVGYVPIALENYETNTGTWSYSGVVTDWRAGLWALASALNNLVRWDYVALKKGTYVLRCGCRMGNSFGVAHIKLNGSTVGTIDFYNAATLTNQRRASGTFVVADDGIYMLTLQMASKNASSSAYNMQLNWMELIRTGD